MVSANKNANLELIDENGAIEENNIVASTVENSTSNSENGVDLNLKSTEKMEEKDGQTSPSHEHFFQIELKNYSR